MSTVPFRCGDTLRDRMFRAEQLGET
jgi:hypothetical protein